MSYEKEISFRDYDIVFEFEVEEDGLYLLNWIAYCGVEEVLIPCRIESEFIEKELNKYLDSEWVSNGYDYLMDREMDRAERRLAFMEDR